MDHIWVYGKVEPGWYMASYNFNEKFIKRLLYLGYRFILAENKPKV